VKITNKELHNLNSPLTISRMIKIKEDEIGGAYVMYVRDHET
jgi:hypothetical protein